MGIEKSMIKVVYSSNCPATILIADDHGMMYDGLAVIIDRKSDLKVCGGSGDLPGAMKLARHLKPDVLILDASITDRAESEVIAGFLEMVPAMRILVVAKDDERESVEGVFRAGALGYMLKSDPAKCVTIAIRRMLDGGVFLSDRVMAKMFKNLRFQDTDMAILAMIRGWPHQTGIADDHRDRKFNNQQKRWKKENDTASVLKGQG